MRRHVDPSDLVGVPGQRRSRRAGQGRRAKRNEKLRAPDGELTASRVTLCHLGGLTALAIALAISVPLGLLVYPIIGMVICHHVGQRVDWISQLASVRNISSAKLGLILRWPTELPILAMRLFVVRRL